MRAQHAQRCVQHGVEAEAGLEITTRGGFGQTARPVLSASEDYPSALAVEANGRACALPAISKNSFRVEAATRTLSPRAKAFSNAFLDPSNAA